MSGDQSAPSVWSTLRAVFGFALLAALAGFVFGMWEEVAVARERYVGRELVGDYADPEHWSIRAGRVMGAFQGWLQDSLGPEEPITRRRDGVGSPPNDPENPKEPVDPLDLLKEYPKPIPPEPGPPPAPRPEPKPEPKAGPRPEPRPGPKPEPKPPGLKVPPGMSVKTAQLLAKARAARDVAMKYYVKASPKADPRGRAAANRETLKYLKIAQRYYQETLKGKMTKYHHKRVTAELVAVQRRMYWCGKFQSGRRRR